MEPIDWKKKVEEIKKKINEWHFDESMCPSMEYSLFSKIANTFPLDNKTCGKYVLSVLMEWAKIRNDAGLSSKFTRELVSTRLSQFGLDENSDYTPRRLIRILLKNQIGARFSSYFFDGFPSHSLTRLTTAYEIACAKPKADNPGEQPHKEDKSKADNPSEKPLKEDKSKANNPGRKPFVFNLSVSSIDQTDETPSSDNTDEELSSLLSSLHSSSDTSNLIEKDPVDKLINPADSLDKNCFLQQCALCVLKKKMTCGPYYFMSIFIPKLQITCENDNTTLKLDISHKSIDEHMTNISKLEETLENVNVSDNCSTMTPNDLKRLKKKGGYNKESLLKLETKLKSQNKLKKLAKNYASILTTAKRVYDKMNRLMDLSLWDSTQISAKNLVSLYKKKITQSKKSAKADKNVEPTNFDTNKLDNKNHKNQKMPVFSPIDKEMKNLQEMEVSDSLRVFEKVEIERVEDEVRKAKIKTKIKLW